MPSLRFDQNIFELQPLEIRRLLTTATIDPGNLLHIVGTGSAETITVNKNNAGRITISGVVDQFNLGSSAGQINKILIEASGGNDTVLLTNNVRFANNAGIPSTIAGNNGNDTITGGPGNDIINGNDGNDLIDGGGGNDEFTGGNNFDTANYTTRTGAIDVDIDNIADDGEGAVGENDNVTTSMEEVLGGSGNDTLTGSGNADYFGGGGGADSMTGGNGNDQLTGSSGQDKFFGQNGNDFLVAQNNDQDTVNGGTNSDGTADTDLASIDVIDVAAALSVSNALARVNALAAASGATLDPSFDTDGRAVGPSSLRFVPVATAVDAAGRIYFAGTRNQLNAGQVFGDDIVVVRFLANGAFDTNFGNGGVASIDFTLFNGTGSSFNDNDTAAGIAIDNDGNIVVAGTTNPRFGGGDSDFAVARLTENGILDTNFNDGGLQVVDIVGSLGSGYNDEAADIAIQDFDGKIVVVGTYNGDQVAVLRLTDTGVLDDIATNPGSAFNGDGQNTYSVGSLPQVTSVALQPNGDAPPSILVGGALGDDFLLVRIQTEGSIDTFFGNGDGIVTTDFNGGADIINDITVNSDNSIVAVGNSILVEIIPPENFIITHRGVVAVYVDDGSGGMSSIVEPPTSPGSQLSFNGVAVDDLDRIIVAGAESGDYVTARYRLIVGDNNKTPFEIDPDFSDDLVHTEVGGDGIDNSEFDVGLGAFSVAGGKIVIAGWSTQASTESTTVSAIRWLATDDGNPEPEPVPNNGEAEVTDVEGFPTWDELHSQPLSPRLQPYRDSVSDIAWFYTLSQLDGDGVAHIVVPEGILDNNVHIYDQKGGDGHNNIVVNVDGVALYYDVDGTNRILLYTGDGNDTILIDRKIDVPLLIDTGAGDDNVTGGTGDEIMILGAGNDVATTGQGDDVVIGGAGADIINGSPKEDLIIAGTTAYDADLDALIAIQNEWITKTHVNDRIEHLRNGGGANGTVLLRGASFGAGATVFDDSAIDIINGNGAKDWLFVHVGGANADQLLGGGGGRVIDEI